MIQKTLKTISGKLKISIPDKLNQITLGQLIALQSKENLTDIEAVHILSGVALEELKQVKDFNDFQTFSDIILGLSYQIKYLYNSDIIPAKIFFNVSGKPKEVKVIKNLSIEPAGAFMAAREVIAEEIAAHITKVGEDNWKEFFNPSLKACAMILAHYFYCTVTAERYDEHKAELFAEEVKKLPITDALPISKYFFLSYPNLSKTKTSYLLRLLMCLSRKQASKHSKSLAISTP